MQTVDLTQLELRDGFPGMRVAFPVSSATGTAATSAVYMDIEPGAEVPEHRDSSEETLIVLEGEIEAFVDDEQGRLTEGELAVVPAMAPHGLRNLGPGRARVLGFFAGSTTVSTFAEPAGPEGWQVNVIGAPAPLAVPLEEPVAV